MAAQDERERCKTAELGVRHIMSKWIPAEKVWAGLRHAAVCLAGRTKERIAQSKRARAGSLAIIVD